LASTVTASSPHMTHRMSGRCFIVWKRRRRPQASDDMSRFRPTTGLAPPARVCSPVSDVHAVRIANLRQCVKQTVAGVFWHQPSPEDFILRPRWCGPKGRVRRGQGSPATLIWH
jgi:hypothetical protein